MSTKTFAEINLNNLVYNINAIKEKVAPSEIIPVVKANAYGHGAVAATKHLVKEGFSRFAVAQFEEAMELRDSGISHPILIFGRLFPDEISKAIKAGFRISLFGIEDIRWIEKAGQEQPANIIIPMMQMGIWCKKIIETALIMSTGSMSMMRKTDL